MFRLGNFERLCDSYYFATDRDYDAEEGSGKTREVLRLLLDQWIAHIGQLRDSECIYLPFDFSDQYTGCMRVMRRANKYGLTPGWSAIEGFLHCPSDISRYVWQVKDFSPCTDYTLTTTRELLLPQLEASRDSV